MVVRATSVPPSKTPAMCFASVYSVMVNKFLQSLLVLSPKKIVYVSCNPVTLGENLAVLVDAGYCMKKAVPVDMFPFVEGIETVVLLSRTSA